MVFFLFIAGLFIGSFLNVLADRLPRSETLTGRSHCEYCKHVLSGFDLIPVLSFVLLQGKCRYCHAKLSIQYPIVEILTGFIFALTYEFLITNGQFGVFNLSCILVVLSAFIVIFFADLRYQIIPDKILLPAITIVFVWLLIGNSQLIFNHLISGLGAFLFFLILYLLTKGRGMGFGDVKLAFLIGFFLGFPLSIFALYFAFLTGGAMGIILIIWKKKTLKSALPFGTFLVWSTIFFFFFQEASILQNITRLFAF